MTKMRANVFVCGISLLIYSTLSVSCFTNAEFYDVVKDYITEGAEFDDVEDDVLDLPGGPNEKVDIGRLLNRLGDIRATVENIKEIFLSSPNCECKQTSCRCCISKTFTEHKYELNACLNAAIKDRGFEISFIVNGDRVLHRGYWLSRGTTFDFPLPNLPEAKIFLTLYDIDLAKHSMCTKLKIEEFQVELELGCFRIGENNPENGFDSYFDHFLTDDGNSLRYILFPRQKRHPQFAMDAIDELNSQDGLDSPYASLDDLD